MAIFPNQIHKLSTRLFKRLSQQALLISLLYFLYRVAQALLLPSTLDVYSRRCNAGPRYRHFVILFHVKQKQIYPQLVQDIEIFPYPPIESGCLHYGLAPLRQSMQGYCLYFLRDWISHGTGINHRDFIEF